MIKNDDFIISMNKLQEMTILAVARNRLPLWNWGHKSDREPPEVRLVEKFIWKFILVGGAGFAIPT